jgi:hypothetical protein
VYVQAPEHLLLLLVLVFPRLIQPSSNLTTILC